tara:strand:+ start:13125 stop:13892 length:768 start_codon:yes stop_codon:yes gene_type:complete
MNIKNEIWNHIININNIDLNVNLSILTASQIKDSKDSWTGENNQFEPRLLCKIDKKESRPQVFIDNNICILSIKNGTYALIKEDIYIPLPKYFGPTNKISNESNSLILDIGESETTMLDKLYYTNTLSNIIGEKIKYGPLLGGRHRCNFRTIIGKDEVEINGSQYETDGCYETDNYICIVEAKSINCNDFNIRQLYYPYREVYKKVKDKKQIICLFIHKDKKDKDIIHIHKFRWNDYRIMMDIIHLDYYQYKFGN